MIEFDLKNSIYYKGNMTSRAQENKNKKILLFAKECKENDLDLTKKMNQLLKFSDFKMIQFSYLNRTYII